MRTVEDLIKEFGEIPLCQCGCGNKVNVFLNNYQNYKNRGGFPKFLERHNTKGINHPSFGKKRSKDTIQKLKNSHIGQKPWNKNKSNYTIENCIRDVGEIPLCQCGCNNKVNIQSHRYTYYKKYGYPKFIFKHQNLGRHHLKESNLKNKEKHLGKSSPMKGKKLSQEQKIKSSEGMIKYFKLHPEEKLKMSEKKKEFYKLHPEVGLRHSKKLKGRPSPKLHLFSALDHLIKDKYCRLFSESLKEKVRIRDNHTCQNCGVIQNGRKHTVHHIHYDKKNCYPDLICLCNKCNIKANTNRNYWEQLFMNKLNDRQLLFWTKRLNR